MPNLQGCLGLAVLLLIAWLLSEDRRHIPYRIVLGGFLMQFGLALLLLKFPPAAAAFLLLNHAVGALQTATDQGTALVFGYLGGGPLPYAESSPGGSYILAFRAFPLVLTISALSSLGLYWGLLQKIVAALAFLLRHALGIGGALGLGAVVHIFVGMIEAPLLIRPYLKTMQRGEIFALMSCGMAGIAGTVMVIYASILAAVIPDSLGTILIASLISTPAALSLASIMVPFHSRTGEKAALIINDPPQNFMEAIVRGTQDGIGIVANIIAMLIVLVALVSLINLTLTLLPHQEQPVTLQDMLGFLLKPLMWLTGISWSESGVAAKLMATKTILNEFVAYLDLAHIPPGILSPRSRFIMTFALCGFANFGSLGIMLGGMTAMVPERKKDILDLGLRSLVCGTLATLMSAAAAGLLTDF